MINVNSKDGKVNIEMKGNLQDICSDLTIILISITESLDNKNKELGRNFRLCITKAFLDGVLFGDDKDAVAGYIKEAEKVTKDNDELDRLANSIKQLLKIFGGDR